jgi:hypothetical protein
MSGISGVTLLFGVLAVMLAAALFMLYQHPLMEIYLDDWALC